MSFEQFFYAACGAGVLLCLLSLLLIRRRPLAGLLALVVTVSFTTGTVLLTRDLLSYRRLGDEELVAKIYIGERDHQRYVVSIDQRDDSSLQSFMIAGDEWQLDSRVIKWKKDLARLGFENIFRLDRISGRYADVESETTEVRTAYKVNHSDPVDFWRWVRDVELLWNWVEADLGSAVFAPLTDGAQYGVYLSHTGLTLRPENPLAAAALRQWQP